MATICARRCKLSYIKSNPRALFTYGSPRVGNGRYVNYVQYEAYRWVNNNDIVTRVPPGWLGYRHKGQEVYLERDGEIRRAHDLAAYERSLARLRARHPQAPVRSTSRITRSRTTWSTFRDVPSKRPKGSNGPAVRAATASVFYAAAGLRRAA